MCKIHEVLGTVNWEIIHWPKLRCLFLTMHELLEAGASRASSFLPWCGGTVAVSYRFINPGMWYSPLGASGSGPGPGSAHCDEGAESMYQYILEWGKRAGKAFLRPQKTCRKLFKGRKQMSSSPFIFIPLTSISACKQDSFWCSHQQTCTLPEMHSSFGSCVTEDSTWKMCFELFHFINLMRSCPDICHFHLSNID